MANLPLYKSYDRPASQIRLIRFARNDQPESENEDGVVVACFIDTYDINDDTQQWSEHQTLKKRSNSITNGTKLMASSLAGKPRFSTHDTTSFDQPQKMKPARFVWGDYIAMSYTWEPRYPEQKISVDGKTISVAQNIAQGLYSLSKYLQSVQSSFMVWNDFLCIDQNDQKDIERELKRMSFIFSHASKVLVYVGPADDNSHLVMRRLTDCEHALESLGAASFLESFKRDEWVAFAKFLQRKYWRRMWVVQEIALSDLDSVLICGTEYSSMKALWVLARLIIDHTSLCHRLLASAFNESGFFGKVRNEVFSICSRIHSIHKLSTTLQRNEPFDLIALLRICRRSLQQDARDKVYSILGLIPQNVSALIEPDLSKSVHAVHTDLAMAVIKATKSLDILQSCLIASQGEPILPSWVPNLQMGAAAYPLGSRPRFNSGGDQFSQLCFFRRDYLICRGVILDELDHLTPPQWPDNPVTAEQRQDMETSSQPTIENVRETLWRTLVGDRATIDSDDSAPEQYRCLLDLPWPRDSHNTSAESLAQRFIDTNSFTANERHDLITFLRFRERATQDFQIGRFSLGDFFPCSADLAALAESTNPPAGEGQYLAGQTQNQSSPWLYKALHQAAATMKRRRLIVTTHGYLGASIRECKKGDKIAVIQGCNVPIILRRQPSTIQSKSFVDNQVAETNDLVTLGLQNSNSATDQALDGAPKYVVVGDCYVHGVMRGEAWHQPSLGAQQDIVLC